MSRLTAVTLDDAGIAPPTPEVEQERKVAIYDLLEANAFTLCRPDAPPGPYKLHLAVRERRLIFALTTESGEPAGEIHLSLGPLNQIIKDYYAICGAYYDAVRRLPPAKIEAIDMGRRGIHNEGARLLKERLEGKAEIDEDTARRLFTLVCVLHVKG